jgi:heme a synthase
LRRNERIMETKKIHRFRRLALVTTAAVIFLIWVGGWVRSTGSGMGCPDWPKCFGVWIPPTTEAALPADYATHYVDLRKKKNTRVAKMLTAFGMTELADKIQNDPSVFTHEPFNAYKTWTEYLNRLVGVVVGFLIFLTVLAAFPLRKLDKAVFWLSFAAFIGVGFEGWLGSIVVSTNLMPAFITVHMIVAMLILVALIAAVLRTFPIQISTEIPPSVFWLGLGVCGIILTQIIIGTQVRENVDAIKMTVEHGQIIQNLGDIYQTHRWFYYAVAAAVLIWSFLLRGIQNHISAVKWLNFTLLTVLFSEIAMGIAMHRFGLPPVLQPLHLLFATLLFSAAYTIVAVLNAKPNQLTNQISKK